MRSLLDSAFVEGYSHSPYTSQCKPRWMQISYIYDLYGLEEVEYTTASPFDGILHTVKGIPSSSTPTQVAYLFTKLLLMQVTELPLRLDNGEWIVRLETETLVGSAIHVRWASDSSLVVAHKTQRQAFNMEALQPLYQSIDMMDVEMEVESMG